MATRKPTNSDAPTPDWTLSDQQRTAVDLIVTGRNYQETADAIGVERQTVSKWANHNPAFQAELNLRRQELWGELSHKLKALVPRALQVLEAELDGEDRLSAAIHTLKAVNLYGWSSPPGETRVEVLAAHQALADFDRAHAAEDMEAAISARAQRRALERLTGNILFDQ